MAINDSMYVTFKLGEEDYGFNIEHVISIEKILPKTRIPNSPDFLEGVINLRGEVIGIINLRKKFQMDDKDLDKDSRIIICTCKGITAGIIVDSTSEVIRIDDSLIDSPNITEGNKNYKYIKGIGKLDSRVVTILKLEELLEN